MKRILLSLLVVGAVGGTAFFATNAFFSDTETSTGNTFVAGAIDLLIDNESYGFDWNDPEVSEPVGNWGPNSANSWQESDLDGELFFSFADLKPGDYGEDTISLRVNDNDAYACMAFDLTGTQENALVDPEAEAGDVTTDDGELQKYLSFLFWHDDGDNVLETGETVIQELSGLPGSVFTGEWLALAEGGQTPLAGGTTNYIGKGWCFGTMTATPVTPADNPNGPTVGNTGFTCDGAGDQNDAQTDGILVDVGFYAVQSRNNSDFDCSSLPAFGGGEQEVLVGAAFGAYDDPASCDFTVTGGNSIQTAINDAVAGNTVCVDPTYTGAGDSSVIEVNKENLILAGIGAAGSATVAKGLHIDANGVTIEGLTLNSYPQIESSAFAAIYVNSSLTGVSVLHNKIVATGGAKAADAKGVITEIGNSVTPGVSGLTVSHNLVQGWNQGMFFNTANVNVGYNDIYDNNVGIANDGPHASAIHHNDFEDNDSEAVGVAPMAINGTTNNGLLAVNTNNFAPAGTGNEVNWYGPSLQASFDVDATNNWWSGEAVAFRTNNPGEVDTEPAEASAYAEN